ncbi:MAG TPA: hypothetical protein PKL48_06390, partial [Thermodesulfobacteriota bacterium]|nr:hypothetical protein [Thermodesulfobacteriota bacterium]
LEGGSARNDNPFSPAPSASMAENQGRSRAVSSSINLHRVQRLALTFYFSRTAVSLYYHFVKKSPNQHYFDK